MALPHAIATAVGGFLIGGPPGAAIGGVIGLMIPAAPAAPAAPGAPAGPAVPTDIHVSPAATATDVEAAVATSTAAGGSLILAPDNALHRIRMAIDSTAQAASGAGVDASAWQQSATTIERQLAASLMMDPGNFRPMTFPAPPSGTPAGAVSAFNAAVADAMSALQSMDAAKKTGMAEFAWWW